MAGCVALAGFRRRGVADAARGRTRVVAPRQWHTANLRSWQAKDTDGSFERRAQELALQPKAVRRPPGYLQAILENAGYEAFQREAALLQRAGQIAGAAVRLVAVPGTNKPQLSLRPPCAARSRGAHAQARWQANLAVMAADASADPPQIL